MQDETGFLKMDRKETGPERYQIKGLTKRSFLHRPGECDLVVLLALEVRERCLPR